MPRTTRAALRNAILEDPEVAAEVPLPSTPQKGDRVPLGEIQINEEAPKIKLEVNLSKPEKKAPKKTAKGAGRKKKAGNKENARPGEYAEVMEDDCESSASSAVEEACQDLRDGSKDANFRAPYLDRRPQTPPSKAVRAARRKLSPKPTTPRFDPEIHKAPESAARKNAAEDSFIAVIESRTPAKIANAELVLEEVQEEGMAESSIIEDAVTPQRITEITREKSPRIEDSVEAIDALEEAIERAGESFADVKEDDLLPVSNSTAASTVPTKAQPTSLKKDATKPKANTSKPLAEKKSSAKKVAVSTKPATTRPAASAKAPKPGITKAAVTKKPSQLTTPKPAKPTPSKAAPKATKPRVSSVTSPPFVPAKSSKPPTRSTFTLPGEAVSARLKAQREERLKQEADEQKKRREFKARPAPSGRTSSGSSATLPRQTASSRARESLAKGEKIGETTVVSRKPTAAVKPRVSSTGAVIGARSPPTKPAPTSVKRPSPSRPINPSPNKVATAAAPAKAGSVRGKPALVSAKAEHDKAIKDKLEAAKKARVEAAERGRAASREWAEKKRKEMEARKASGGSKSMGESAVAAGAPKAVVA